MSQHEQFPRNARLRIKVCVYQLEDLIRFRPETNVKAKVEILRTQYEFFSWHSRRSIQEERVKQCGLEVYVLDHFDRRNLQQQNLQLTRAVSFRA